MLYEWKQYDGSCLKRPRVTHCIENEPLPFAGLGDSKKKKKAM